MIRFYHLSLTGPLALSTKPIQSHTYRHVFDQAQLRPPQTLQIGDDIEQLSRNVTKEYKG